MGIFGKQKSGEKSDRQAAANRKEEAKARFTGCAMQPIGEIEDGSLCKLTFDPDKREMQIQSGKVLETISYDRLRSFTVDSDVTVVKHGNGLGAAIIKNGMGEAGERIVGQTVSSEQKKIKWVGEMMITADDGGEQSLCFIETTGALGSRNKTTVKSYDTQNFEQVFARIVQDAATQ